jgi:alkylation response protein AidB-like acyl-CoA dehydrogenase
MTDTATPESVDDFRARARRWLADSMPRLDPECPPRAGRDDEGAWQRARDLQKSLHEGGFAGICFPREYGGLGLDVEYQEAFNVEAAGYEMPLILNVPTFAICCASLLDTGTEAQKHQHIAAALRGEEVLVQLLSEPSGGSDLAGLITRDARDGDGWIINGAKTWSTSAFAADYGLLLARTDPTVPKHDGLTMFLVPIHAPGVTLRRIKQVDGSDEFCEEFFDGLRVGVDAVVGEVNNGWEVASRLLFHERRAVGQGSEFASGRGRERSEDSCADVFALAATAGKLDDPATQDKIGRLLARRMVRDRLVQHVAAACELERCPRRRGRSFVCSTPTSPFSKWTPPRKSQERLVLSATATRTACSVWVSGTCRVSRSLSAGAAMRWLATSSPNACWSSPANTRPTAACRSIRSNAIGRC